MRLSQFLPRWEALIVALGNRNKCDPMECFKRLGRVKFVMLSYKDVVSQTENTCLLVYCFRYGRWKGRSYRRETETNGKERP